MPCHKCQRKAWDWQRARELGVRHALGPYLPYVSSFGLQERVTDQDRQDKVLGGWLITEASSSELEEALENLGELCKLWGWDLDLAGLSNCLCRLRMSMGLIWMMVDA